MPRVALVHWKPEEAPEKLEELRAAGFAAELAPRPPGREWKALCAAPPEAFVLDLDRLPSHSRAVAQMLRQQKSTRLVPIVFAGGAPEKVEKARVELPDAHFAGWKRIASVLRKAIRQGVSAPVVPPRMGEAKTALTRRLGIREGSVVTIVGAPARFERKLEPLPEGAVLQAGRGDAPGMVLVFAASSLELVRRFDRAVGLLGPAGGKLWLMWPKRASGVETDLTMPFLRQYALDAGWVDYKVCSVDDVWSGMLFGRRRKVLLLCAADSDK